MAATVEPLLTNSGRKLIPPFQLDLVHVDCGLLCKLTQWGPTPKWTHLVEQSVPQSPLGSSGYQDHHWPRPRLPSVLSKEAGLTGQTASLRVRDRVIMLSWCPVQRSKASTRVRHRVIMLSWCPVQRSKASTRVRDRVIMLSRCPVQRSKASTRGL